ncbi:hrp65 protein isoform X3 [Lutzomyia longipalpis]|uniref:hrp65 protein isoform X3 n=1 Tax=Lutzomyia longipalpis TaxID=7200 RepID=UPI002483850E|nr:hrp65 protein isoform X3 [Lutzomyia longipalpis]
MSEAKVESETPLPQRAQNQGNPGNQAMKANNDGDGQMGGSQQMGGGGGGGPMGGKKPQQRNFQQGKNMRGGNRGFGGGGGGPRNQMNRQNRGNPQRNEGQMKFSKKRQNEPNRDGGDDRMQQQQRGPFQRPKNEDFGIQQRLKHLQGPMHDIPPLDQSEIKFCGRNRLYIGNLTNDVTEEELRQLFAPFGEIGEVFLNPEKNFAFIKVDYHANAERAKRELDGTMRKGKQMRIRFAPNGTILKVRNIAPFVSNELLYKSFEVFGQVERAVVIVDDRGKPSGEGIVEYSRKASAMTAMRLCSERCYFLTSSLRPVVLEMMEHVDDIDGYPEKSINKKMNDFGQARQVGPRFAEPGSFEHEYGTRWKQLYEMFKQKQDGLKRELAIEEDKLEAQMEYARYEHETEMLREQLRMREQDRDRQKKQWEMKKDHHEEMRTREEVQMRQHQEDIQMRMMRQDDELRKRQQENTLFMQAQQLSSLLDQQERKNFDDRRGNFNNQGGPDMNQMNQMNDAIMDDHFNRQQSRFDDGGAKPGGVGGVNGGPRGNARPWDRRGDDNFPNKRRRF